MVMFCSDLKDVKEIALDFRNRLLLNLMQYVKVCKSRLNCNIVFLNLACHFLADLLSSLASFVEFLNEEKLSFLKLVE